MAGILRDAEADAEGFIGGEERGPRGRDLSSRKQRRTIARKQFSDDKDRGEIPMGSPQRECRTQVGKVNSGDSRLVSRCKSETVQDRDI